MLQVARQADAPEPDDPADIGSILTSGMESLNPAEALATCTVKKALAARMPASDTAKTPILLPGGGGETGFEPCQALTSKFPSPMPKVCTTSLAVAIPKRRLSTAATLDNCHCVRV